jgi:hypothetical protein
MVLPRGDEYTKFGSNAGRGKKHPPPRYGEDLKAYPDDSGSGEIEEKYKTLNRRGRRETATECAERNLLVCAY